MCMNVCKCVRAHVCNTYVCVACWQCVCVSLSLSLSMSLSLSLCVCVCVCARESSGRRRVFSFASQTLHNPKFPTKFFFATRKENRKEKKKEKGN